MTGAEVQQVTSAAVNNAEWCDAVCRSHGLEGTFRSDAWTSAAMMDRLAQRFEQHDHVVW